MSRRKQHVPWTAAGTASEQQHSADDVVRATGWVFNNQTGPALDLAVEPPDALPEDSTQTFGDSQSSIDMMPPSTQVHSIFW